MDTSHTERSIITEYDEEQDIFYLCFKEKAQEAIAEEMGDDIFVRFDPNTNDIITIEFLNFRPRLENLFGKDLKFTGSELPELILTPQIKD